MIYCGIDPGATGSVVIINGDKLEIYKTADDNDEAIIICSAIKKLPPDTRIAIEDLHALFQVRADTTFALGWSCGFWHGVCNANGFKPTLIKPKVWQEMMTVAPVKIPIPKILPKAVKDRYKKRS